jgi:copper(I)-binding protein
MNMFIRLAAIAASALLLTTVAPALAQDSPAMATMLGNLEISGGFTRATLPNAPVGGGYVTITNKGAEADRLVSASSPVAGLVQLHEMKMDGDVMKMAELPDGIEVPAGATVTLNPGGFHIMFMDLKQPLVEGTKVPLTLNFEKAGSVEVQLDVGGIAATGPAMDHAMHGDAAGEHQHGSGMDMNMDMAGMSDEAAIASMQEAMFDKPDHPLVMGAIVVSGDYAISGWAQDGSGGRALLRKTAKGWGVHLCAGDGLKDAAELVKIGVPAEVAQDLARQLAAAEANLDPALVAEFSKFDGVMMIDASLI